MKNIYIYPIKSMMSYGDLINKESTKLLEDLKNINKDFNFLFIDDLSKINKHNFLLILVQSGGSEGIFKDEIYTKFNGPYYLLTYGSSNSLAASLEILTFIKDNSRKGEVLHGDINYISNRIIELYNNKFYNLSGRLGVLGKPSDWLISSNVDYTKAKNIFNIDLIDISNEEVIDTIKNATVDENTDIEYDKKEVNKALKIYSGLKKIVNKYHLDGFTIRCFDIIKEIKSSACLALSLFNKDNIIASCEGDIPSMISAYIILKHLNKHSFQANPQWINPLTNTIELAHCTLPLDMANKIIYDTHFESGIGIGLHGEMAKEDVTILKINSALNEFYAEEGTILNNEYRLDRCRTQIKIKLNNGVSYFLKSSLGNHHLVFYGHKKEQIKNYLESFGLRNVK